MYYQRDSALVMLVINLHSYVWSGPPDAIINDAHGVHNDNDCVIIR